VIQPLDKKTSFIISVSIVSCSVLYSTLHPLHLLAKSLPVIVIAGWVGDAVIDHIFDHLLVSDEL
jgi:hypothetical protein